MTPKTTNQNPLHARPLTVDEYSRLSRTLQIKTGWLLKDHLSGVEAKVEALRAELDAKMVELKKPLTLARNKLVRREEAIARTEAKAAKAEEELRTDTARAEERLAGLKLARRRARDAVRAAEKRLAEAEKDLPELLARAEDAEARLAAARTRWAAAESSFDIEARDFAIRTAAEARLARLRLLPDSELDEGEKHLLELDRELGHIGNRKPKAADAVLRAEYPLAG